MTDIKRILVPVDGSETSDRAIEEAIKIAEVYNSDIHILYVANINQLAINACLSDAILEAVTKAGNEILEKAANKVPEKINVITTSETGSPSCKRCTFRLCKPICSRTCSMSCFSCKIKYKYEKSLYIGSFFLI